MQFESQQQKEMRLVAETYRGNQLAQYELYSYCADYYFEKYTAIFSAPEDTVKDIFQNSFITFWEHIESKRIYIEDNVIKGKDNNRLKGSIRTYFMGIAKIKYLEWGHEHPFYADPETEMGKQIRTNGFDEKEYMQTLYDDGDNTKLEIIADLLSHMSTRCYEILTKFYYERKDLDKILEEIPSIESKNALKTKKHKCMENLRKSALEIYQRFIND